MNAIKHRFAALLGAVLLWCSGLGLAQAQANAPWYPAQGVYWSPFEHGIYYHVSVGPTGFVFVAITTYRADGSPDFLIMQGQFAATTREEWSASGSLGKVESPLYRMQDGQCLGCPYRNPQVVASEYGNASLEFLNDGRARFRSTAHNADLVRNPLLTSTAELPRNRMQGIWAVSSDYPPRNTAGIVQIGPQFAPRSGMGAEFALFPSNALLAWTCIGGDCNGLSSSSLGALALGARDDGIIRRLQIECTRFSCFEGEHFTFHDREGLLLGRNLSSPNATLRGLTMRQIARANPTNLSPDGSLPWLPQNGLWWNPNAHGIYYHVNSNADGFLFVGITLFQSDGKPTHLVMQGQYEPTTIAQWRPQQVGEIGRLRSPIYRMQGGQCLGCTHREPTVSRSEYGDAEIVFFEGGSAEFRYGGRTETLKTFRLVTGADSERAKARVRLQGRWLATVAGPGSGAQMGIVDISGQSFIENALALRCVQCDSLLTHAFVRGSNQFFLASDAGNHVAGHYFIGFGLHVTYEFAFHERDGVLYGRWINVPSGSADFAVVMHRIGDAPP